MSRKSRARRRRSDLPIKRTPPGAAPGTLVADPSALKPLIRACGIGPETLHEAQSEKPELLDDFLGKYPLVWVNVEGLGDAEVIAAVGRRFGLHPLSLEDVLHTHQRPKVERYEDYLYLVAREARLNQSLETEQNSIFIGRNFVLTFQESRGGRDETVRERLRKGAGVLRSRGPDYLAYCLLDVIIDGYFPILETFGERLEALEGEVVANPQRTQVQAIHEARRNLLAIRRSIWPLREALGILQREPSDLVAPETRIYLRDCYDHTIQILDFVETYREVATGLMDVYLSSMSNRLNEIMKVLTIIATIFIPLSFIAGIYGMNFDTQVSPWNMPELKWRFGYPFALSIMAVLTLSLLWYFRRNGWLGGEPARRRGRTSDSGGENPPSGGS
jgi:magnesium transporter